MKMHQLYILISCFKWCEAINSTLWCNHSQCIHACLINDVMFCYAIKHSFYAIKKCTYNTITNQPYMGGKDEAPDI